MDINLLPWRAEIIAYNKKVFTRLILSTLVLAGVVLILLYHLFFGQLIYTNSYMRTLESSKVSLLSSITGYFTYKKEEQELTSRFATLQNLQKSRFETIRILNAIVQTIPKGIYLTSLTRKEGQIHVTGVSNSNLLIAQFMRAVNKSSELKVVTLNKVEKVEKKDLSTTDFELNLVLASQESSIKTDKNKTEPFFNNPIEHLKKLKDERELKIENISKTGSPEKQ